MNRERWYQTQIESGRVGQVCWIDHRLKPGQKISLIGDKRTWTVIHQYPTVNTKPGIRKWNVGGIQ